MARTKFRMHKKRSLIASIALLLSAASVVPFVEGQPLYSYWESVGKYLLILAIVMVVIWGGILRAAINSYAYLSKLENEY